MKNNIKNSGDILYTLTGLPKIIEIVANYTEEIMKIPEMPELMKEDFDLLIYEGVMGDLYLGLASHFKCPSVAINSFESTKALNDLVGNPTLDSVVSSFFLHHDGPMTFPYRFFNYFMNRILEILMISAENGVRKTYQ